MKEASRSVTYLDSHNVVCVTTYYRHKPTLADLWRYFKYGFTVSVSAPMNHRFKLNRYDKFEFTMEN